MTLEEAKVKGYYHEDDKKKGSHSDKEWNPTWETDGVAGKMIFEEAVAKGYAGEWNDRGIQDGSKGSWTPTRNNDRLYAARNSVSS